MTARDNAVVLDGVLDEEIAPGERGDTARFRIHLGGDTNVVDEAVLPCVVANPLLADSVLDGLKEGDLLRVTGHLRLPQTPNGAMWVDVLAIDVLRPTVLPETTADDVTSFVERYASYLVIYDPDGLTHVWHEAGGQVGVTEDPSEISDLIHAYEHRTASGEPGGLT